MNDQGKHGLGSASQGFTPAEVAALLNEMSQHVGEKNAITASELGAALGYDVVRGERNLVSQLDGVAYVLGPWNSVGYFLAEYSDQVAAGSHSLTSQAQKMLERAERRADYLAKHMLPTLQASFA